MATAPVTKIRIQIPQGMSVEDVLSKLEVTFETAPEGGIEWNTNYCCVDASVVGPFSTVSANPGDNGNTA